jgi:tetratricopeptide (TPR) repeat protein
MWGAAVAWVLLVPIPRMAMSLGGAQGAVPIVNAPIASGTFWTGLRLAFLTLIDLEQPWFLLRAAFHDAIVAWWIVAFAAVVAAVIVGMAPAAPERPRDHDPPRGLPALGLLWTLLGGLPLALVGSRFNAYYVSFAAVGFALLVGCLLARASWLAVGAFALATFMNLAANATGAFRIDENDHAAPTGVSIMSFGRLESDARYANGLERFLRDHPPRPGSVIYFSQPFGYNQMGTGGEYAPRVWCDDPTLSTRVLRSYRRGAETSPAMFVRYDENPPRFSAMSESLAASIVEGEDAMYRNDPAAARAELADAVALTQPGAQDALRAELLNTLGVAAERMRDSVTARRSWQEAVRLSPTNRGALINLARLHLREGNPAEAQRWIERALASHPNDPLAREYAARIERALQR